MSKVKFIHQPTPEIVDFSSSRIWIIVDEFLPPLIPTARKLPHVSASVDSTEMRDSMLYRDGEVIDIDSTLREEIAKLAWKDVMVGHATDRCG